MEGIVRQHRFGLFVEAEGRCFESAELDELDVPEGTEVDVAPYLGVGDVRRATLRWTVFESTYTVDAREAS